MGTELAQTMERATRAWQERWAKEADETPPEVHRYRVTFTCDAETFEIVKSALKGFGLAQTVYRVVDEELR